MRARASAGPGSRGTRGGGGFDFREWVQSRWGKATIAGLAFLLVLSGYVAYTLRDLPDPGKQDRKSTRLNSSHSKQSRMPSSA